MMEIVQLLNKCQSLLMASNNAGAFCSTSVVHLCGLQVSESFPNSLPVCVGGLEQTFVAVHRMANPGQIRCCGCIGAAVSDAGHL